MIDIYSIVLLIWIHFFADFICQTDYMAINKSKKNLILLVHVLVYCIPFLIFGLKFALINAVLHFITDWFTSRITSYLWKKEQRHWFFVVIGLDQAIHMTCLFLTYFYFK